MSASPAQHCPSNAAHLRLRRHVAKDSLLGSPSDHFITSWFPQMIASTQTNHPMAGITHGKNQSPVEVACFKLKEAGLRITQPRVAILAALIKAGRPTSIDNLHGELGANSCDIVTVYRCMAAFESIGLVRRAFLINGTSLYEINLGDPNRYHVVCKQTNHVEALDSASADELRRAVQMVEETLKARGYAEVGHIVEFFGKSPASSLHRSQVSDAVPAVPEV
jgi:Fur family ferric uptake transcriptional regulator